MILCCLHPVWAVLPSLEPLWETLVMGEKPPSQIYSFLPHQKSPSRKVYIPPYQYVIPYPIK